MLYDQNSTNGTWVNGQRILQHVVKSQDRIQIGPNVYVLQQSPQADTPRTPTPTPTGQKQIAMVAGMPPHVLEDYELFDKWEGGMAMVYKARSRKTGQWVAVKILRSQDPYVKDKFIKEIEVGQNLRHPNIVQVLGGGQTQGQWYMVMEFMTGGTLADKLNPKQPMPLDTAIHIIGQMCDALSYAHQRGVYHRDMKPANILFNAEETAKLGDFGIARLAQAVTMTVQGAILGTPKYMSTEQAQGVKVDHRADLYSLGVILYQLLTGVLPFEGKDALALIGAHIKQIPRPPRQLNPQIPPAIEQAVLKALAKNPDQRFQTATEMAQALAYPSKRYRTSSRLTAPGLSLLTSTQLTILLPRQNWVLGRDNIDLDDTEISRQHAKIIYQEGRWWLEDNGSTNGTYLNGRRIVEPALLQPNDEVRLGATIFKVVAE
jgi:serine/threonine protein kinase